MLMLKPLIKYADFNGRARRLEYWLFQLFQMLVYVGLIVMIVAGAGTAAVNRDVGAALGSLGGLVLLGIFALACFMPNLAVAVRRLHDTGRSAWWLLLYAPGALSAATTFQSLATVGQSREAFIAAASHASLFSLIGTFCNLAMFVMTLLPGTRGANRFGDDPKGGGVADIARVFDAPEAEQPAQAEPYKPVFDFGPGSSGSAPARGIPAVREAAPAPRAPQPYSGAPANAARATFGKKR